MKQVQIYNQKLYELNLQDEYYPKRLQQIYKPPKKIYAIGNITILNQKIVAMVGCRKNTDYGKNVALQFSYALSQEGVIIVSGLAKGIDSYAHLGAIYAKAPTIAILGSGLDIIYPKENAKLYEQILQYGGCIISEYPLHTKPAKLHFPERNRLISGIAEGIIVVEAQMKSGTMITVDFALEQGKEVFAVPGNITSINSQGTNMLIQEGAKPVTDVKDILDNI